MFREPEATEPKKSTTNKDLSAPARSTIRRQRTVRYHPQSRGHLPSSRLRTNGSYRVADRVTLLEALHSREMAVTSTRFNDEDTLDVEMEADIAHAEASQRRRFESGRALLRDALSYERSGRRMRVARETSATDDLIFSRPAELENRSHQSNALDSRHRSNSGAMPLVRSEDLQSSASDYMPTPPYTSGDVSRESSFQEATRLGSSASLTPRFAPAHRFDDMNEISFREFVVRQGLDLSELPPLRRMGRRGALEPSRSHQHATPDTVDGLGDRRRSFSPENDSWETLLTTMTPDERLPSVHSSFTSASASASSLSSNSTSSYGTLVTVPSSTEIPDAFPTICDNTDSEESEFEDEQYRNAPDRRTEDYHLREPSGNSSIHALPPSNVLHLVRDGQRARQRRVLEREEELHQMHENLDRLERQIPREWWAAAGLEMSPHGRPGRERL